MGGRKVQIGGAGDAAVTRIAPEVDAHRLAGADEALGAADAAVHGDVGADGVGRAECDGALQVGGVDREWDRGVLAQLRQLLECRNGIFPVADIEVFDLAGDAAGFGQGVGHIGIDPQHRLGPEFVAQAADHRDARCRIGGREFALEEGRAVLGVEPQAIVNDGFGRGFAALPGQGLAKTEVVGERDLLAHRAAEQLIERLAPGLAANIPERHLDSAEGTNEREVDRRRNAAPAWQAEPFGAGDVNRVTADQTRRQDVRDGRGIGG